MLNGIEYSKELPFTTVLMDAWYASNKMMLFISDMKKKFFCHVKFNRLARESDSAEFYKKITDLNWSDEELHSGKLTAYPILLSE